MAVDGISLGRPLDAVISVPATRTVRGEAAGDQTVRLVYAETIGDDLLVDTEDGRKLRLNGAAGFAENLSEGDVLLLRVRASAPTLELEWLGAIASHNQGAAAAELFPGHLGLPSEMAAMRLDQAALRRMVWNDPEPAVLANAWRALMLGASRPGAEGRAMETLADGKAGAGPVARPDDGWGTAVFAWRGLPLYLRFVWERRQAQAEQRKSPGLALLVALRHPEFGGMLLELQWGSGGITLNCAAEDGPTVTLLGNARTLFAGVLGSAGLRLERYAVHQGLASLRPASLPGARVLRQAGPQASPALFRGVAEIVRALGQLHIAAQN